MNTDIELARRSRVSSDLRRAGTIAGLELGVFKMEGLIIRDGTEPGAAGSLEFDLREVLTAIGDAAARSRWTCRNVEYVSRDERNIDVLDRLALSGQPVAGTDLINGISDLIQVINGECEAIDEGGRVWAIVRAVDSSWWEVWSDDPLVLAAVRAKFRTTQTVSDNSVGGKTRST